MAGSRRVVSDRSDTMATVEAKGNEMRASRSLNEPEVRQGVGLLELSETYPSDTFLRSRIEHLLDMGANSLVVDCSRIRFLGAPTLGQLVSCLKSVRHKGGEICLAGVSRKTREVLRITRLAGLFTTADSIDAALQASPFTSPDAAL